MQLRYSPDAISRARSSVGSLDLDIFLFELHFVVAARLFINIAFAYYNVGLYQKTWTDVRYFIVSLL